MSDEENKPAEGEEVQAAEGSDEQSVEDANEAAAAAMEADMISEEDAESISFEEIDGAEGIDGVAADIRDGFDDPTEKDLSAIYDIPVEISAVLGRSKMQVSQLLKLGRGAVVELDRRVGEAIDIYVNNRLVARGEVVVVDDKLGITMTEIVKSER